MKHSSVYTFFIALAVLATVALRSDDTVTVHALSNNSGLSNSSVTTLFQDSEGILWIGTWDGLNRYDGHSVTQYVHSNSDPSSLSHQVIRAISEEDGRHLWIATDYGINRLDKRTGILEQFFLGYKPRYIYRERVFTCAADGAGTVAASFNSGGLYLFDSDRKDFVPVDIKGYGRQPGVVAILFDSNGLLWITTRYGTVLKVSVEDGEASLISEIPLPGHVETRLHYDGAGYMWLTSEGRLCRLAVGSSRPVVEKTDVRIKGRLTSVCRRGGKTVVGTTDGLFSVDSDSTLVPEGIADPVLSLLPGTQDILWVGTDGNGVQTICRRPNFIASFPHGDVGSVRGKRSPVRALLVDHDGRLWVGRKGGGLAVCDDSRHPDSATARYYDVGPGLTDNAVMSLADGDDRVWVGTDGQGIGYVGADGVLRSLTLPDTPESGLLQSVYTILQTGERELYAGTAAHGLFRLTLGPDGRVTDIHNYRHSDGDDSTIGSDIVYDLADEGGMLWIATRGGGLSRLNRNTGEFVTFKASSAGEGSLCSNDVVSLLRDSRGRLWAGTTSGLSMITRTPDGGYAFSTFDRSVGLPNENIHSIQEDSSGRIWVGTSFGVAMINPDDRHATAYYYEDGLQGNEFSDGASFRSDGGRTLYFGGVDGLSIVYPELNRGKRFMPGLVMNSVEVGNAKYPLSDNTIRTTYDAGSINLNFSVTDYLDNKKCRLSYRLEPQEWWRPDNGEWIDLGPLRNVMLNQLSPGVYRLKVRLHNAASEEGATQEYMIKVAGPIWMSWWMICLYFLVAGYYVWHVYHVKRGRLIMRHELELEKQEKLNKEEVHQAKLRFFTNIAHEFSNSITLIYGAAAQMMEYGGADPETRRQLRAIQSNAGRMREQIQELMEFRKAETGYLKPKYARTDMVALVARTSENFIDALESKDIRFSCNVADDVSEWVADRNMLEKIVFNLMSNALKYTPVGGTVALEARRGENGTMEIVCTNSGPGIPPDDLRNVFNRFTILDKFEHKLEQGQYSRTGIGLALCKDLAKLMGGRIDVASELDRFTTFTVTVPEHEPDPDTPAGEAPQLQPVIPAMERECGTGALFEPRRPMVLVVDDQPEIRDLIAEILGEGYRIVPASNGKEALGIIERELPSLILSDIIMPEMNGIEFIKVLKSDERTRFIPVIMLSSGTDIESSVDVLKTGANMFVGKPFHPHYLRAAVENILSNHTMMKSFGESSSAYKEKYRDREVSPDDRAFVDSVIDVLSRNFDNEDYTQEMLATDMALSKIQLYRRLKKITGITPNDFIREYRLSKAARMLTHSDKTVQQIFTECGFHNKAYFYRVFQKTYGCSPREYRLSGGVRE